MVGMLDTFKKKNKDYIFLVNEDVKQSTYNERLDIKITKSLEMIFDLFVDPRDRLALMSYGKNTKKLFNLVSIKDNKTQLRNQINGINLKVSHQSQVLRMEGAENSSDESVDPMDRPQPSNSNLIKAIKESITEFVDNKQAVQINKRVLVLFTTKFDLSEVDKDELQQVIFNLHAL